MSEQLDSLLATVADQGWKIRDPAPPERVGQLAEWFRRRTGTSLPAGYRDLLDRTDGLTVNGAEIYASADATTPKGVAISGLVETNERHDLDFGEESDPGTPTMIGNADRDVFALTDGEWVIADRTDHTVWDRFPDFDTLLDHVLRKYLAT